MGKPTTIRLDETLIREMEALAAATERSRAWHIEQAIRRYLAEEAWQVQAVSDALRAYHAGAINLVPHDEVMARVNGRLK